MMLTIKDNKLGEKHIFLDGKELDGVISYTITEAAGEPHADVILHLSVARVAYTASYDLLNKEREDKK